MAPYGHAMGAAGIGRQAQHLVDLLVARLRPSGLAHMHGAAIAALQCGSDALLCGQRLTQCLPTVIDALGLELQTQHVHEVVGQHADEQVPLHTPVDLMEHRAQAQIGRASCRERVWRYV